MLLKEDYFPLALIHPVSEAGLTCCTAPAGATFVLGGPDPGCLTKSQVEHPSPEWVGFAGLLRFLMATDYLNMPVVLFLREKNAM